VTRRGYNGALHESEEETNKRSDTRGRCSVDDLPDLATPKQVREVLPFSDYQLKALIRERQIGHVRVGSRVMIPRESVRQFIADNRNSGPRLRFLEKRGAYYIVWTDAGRSRERSTGTEDRSRAEIALAEFLKQRSRSAGPCDPSEILVTDVLADYAEEHGQVTAAPWRIAYAVEGLAGFWEGRTVGTVTRETCCDQSCPPRGPGDALGCSSPSPSSRGKR
jgi:hypothetical protein